VSSQCALIQIDFLFHFLLDFYYFYFKFNLHQCVNITVYGRTHAAEMACKGKNDTKGKKTDTVRININVRRVRVTIVAVQKQELLHILNVCLHR
jgi:hypothetical protein